MLLGKQKFTLLSSVFIVIFFASSTLSIKNVYAATMTAASVTMGNSRMSFKAPITSGSAGSSLVTISGAAPDTTTNHLFPGDTVCFTDAGNNVCRDNTTYTVANVPSTTTFNVAAPLTTALTATDYAVASQSGTLTITATTVNQVPIGGKLIITIPANDANSTAKNNDGMPDSAASVALNGFDLSSFAVARATVTGASCTAANWGTAGVATTFATGGGGTTDTTISWTRATSICSAGSVLTISITGIINPAPITGHTQGTADVYGITVATTDSSSNTIDSVVPRVAPVEAVLISATVDESLTLVIAGLTGGAQTYCGSQTYVTSTATSIPWSTQTGGAGFKYSAQQLTVSTNAASGYIVTLQENDQMGKNGNTCTGTAPSAGQFTFSAGTCIRDTVCTVSACDESTAGDWTTATNYGLGYSLASQSGSDAPFYYNEKNRAYSAKQLADVTQGGETAQSIMSNSAPVSASSIYVCYTLSVPGTQPSGYYYNIAKYTATATF